MPSRPPDPAYIATRYARIGRLSLVRRNAGVRQVDLAKRLGTRQATISEWECLVHQPTGQLLVPLGEALLEMESNADDDAGFWCHTTNSYGFYLGVLQLRTHKRGRCIGEFCCVHKPSDHPMRGFRQLWRADRMMMERTCPHGVGHPDPDDVNPFRIHGCCESRCCSVPTVE